VSFALNNFLTIGFSEATSMQDNVYFFIFSHRGFSWEQLRHYMLLLSPIFPTGFQEFLHKHLFIHLHIFPTGFFEDSIHPTWCSSAQGGVLQHIFVTTCIDQQTSVRPPSRQPLCWCITLVRPPQPNCHAFHRRAVSYERHTCIKGRKEWLRNSSCGLNLVSRALLMTLTKLVAELELSKPDSPV
jgi:hypothetical protein